MAGAVPVSAPLPGFKLNQTGKPVTDQVHGVPAHVPPSVRLYAWLILTEGRLVVLIDGPAGRLIVSPIGPAWAGAWP